MLIECQECKSKVSSAAKNCPHCGFPIKPANKDNLYCHECGFEYKSTDHSHCPNCGADNLRSKKALEDMLQMIENRLNPKPRWVFGGRYLD